MVRRRTSLSLIALAALCPLSLVGGCDRSGGRLPVVYRVKIDAPAGGDGLTWETAFDHPQDAVDGAYSGDEIWVAAGAYTRRSVIT